MLLRFFPPLLIVLGLGNSGCTAPQPTPMGKSTENPNPIQVSVVREGHAVHFHPGVSKPDAVETAALNSFLTANGASRGDTVLVERRLAGGAKGDALELRREAVMVAALSRQGLRPSVGYSPSLAPGEMSLTLEHYVANVPDCPNWSKPVGNDFANTLHSDFGCATATNLAAMVDDPHDLLVGRTMGPVVGDPASAPVHAYRTGKVASLSDKGASGGANSTTEPSDGPTTQQ